MHASATSLRALPVHASLVLALCGCNMLSLDASGKTAPATEETVVGTWRNAEPDAQGRTVRMTLRIDDDHNMVWSRRWSKPISDGGDVEYQRESLAWTVAEGKLEVAKTACEYIGDGGVLEVRPCREPLEYAIPIEVNGNAWSIAEGEHVMLFRKDR